MIRIEDDFMLVNLTSRNIGVLKTVGEREIVADIKLMVTANEADNVWLMEQVKSLYESYFLLQHGPVTHFGNLEDG